MSFSAPRAMRVRVSAESCACSNSISSGTVDAPRVRNAAPARLPAGLVVVHPHLWKASSATDVVCDDARVGLVEQEASTTVNTRRPPPSPSRTARAATIENECMRGKAVAAEFQSFLVRKRPITHTDLLLTELLQHIGSSRPQVATLCTRLRTVNTRRLNRNTSISALSWLRRRSASKKNGNL